MLNPDSYTYGSRYQLGRWIADRPGELQRRMFDTCASLAAFASTDLQWIAPTGPDDPKELRDEFWGEIGLTGASPQKAKWWPSRGPVWDAVARVRGAEGEVGGVVVEAKGRLNEISAGGCKATGDSLNMIRHAFLDVQAHLGVSPTLAWLRAYYQMANRLAFLWFARRHGNEQPLWLVWIYFLGERYPTATGIAVGPRSETEWMPAIRAAKHELNLPAHHDVSAFEATLFLPAVAPLTIG